MGVNTFKPDGYGGQGCERVTILGTRTIKQTYLGYGLLVLGSATLCALLVKMKQPKKSSQWIIEMSIWIIGLIIIIGSWWSIVMFIHWWPWSGDDMILKCIRICPKSEPTCFQNQLYS